jgi:hypothetical protein
MLTIGGWLFYRLTAAGFALCYTLNMSDVECTKHPLATAELSGLYDTIVGCPNNMADCPRAEEQCSLLFAEYPTYDKTGGKLWFCGHATPTS